MNKPVTVTHFGVDGVHEKGTENFRSLEGLDSPYYIDHVTKGEGREFYCLTYKSKLKPAFERLDREERDTIFLLCDAEIGTFRTYILASEVRHALKSEQVKLTLPGSSMAQAVKFSKMCGYPCRPSGGTNGSNTAHVKVPGDFLEQWKLTQPHDDSDSIFEVADE